MTTTVKVTACCSDDKEVIFDIMDYGSVVDRSVLQNSESLEKCVYDGRTAIVFEQLKEDKND